LFLRGLLSREFLLYILFGGLTTGISLLTYYVFEDIMGMHYSVANIISWVFAVTFAYVTNKFFVFKATSAKKASLIIEILLFYGARLFSLAIEEGGLFLMIDLMGMSSMLSKVVLQVVVIALNYVFSKLVIFKKR
jgi:putative flippase GtrA